MSYSFSIKAATKDAAKNAVVAKFQEMVLPTQPIHHRDAAAIYANANAVIDLLADDDTKDVAVSCNGYVSWVVHGDVTEVPLNSVSVSCSATHAVRVAA
jgi:hypothetical protein